MKYLKRFDSINEKLNFDVNDIDDILVDLIDADYKYRVNLDWSVGEEDSIQSLSITIWKKGTNITANDMNMIREDLRRLVNYMKQNGYSTTEIYPPRLVSDGPRRPSRTVDKIHIRFSNREGNFRNSFLNEHRI